LITAIIERTIAQVQFSVEVWKDIKYG
jgi:hypothetical protein